MLHNESILSQQTTKASAPCEDQNLPPLQWTRHVSPRIVSSFQLADNHEWNPRDLLHDSFKDWEVQVQGTREQPTCEKWLQVLVCLGWLPSKSSRAIRDLPFFVVLSMEILVLVCLPQESLSLSTFTLIHYIDSFYRHSCVVLAHLGMYCYGGRRLFDVLKDLETPRTHVKLILVLVCIASCIDIYILETRTGLFRGLWHCIFPQPEEIGGRLRILNASDIRSMLVRGFRRLFIMFERWICAVSVIVMMTIPKTLCQALQSVVVAVEKEHYIEAERLYGNFWQHVRLARGWYNAVMSPMFLIAVGRIPVAIYVYTCDRTWETEGRKLSYYIYCMIALVDTLTMMIWIHPAIRIRSNHGVVYRATLDLGFQQLGNGAKLTTLMSSLHQMMGLKIMGFIVKWKLVAQTITLITMFLYVVKIADGIARGATTVEPSTPWIHNCTENNSLFGMWNTGKCLDGARENIWSFSLNGIPNKRAFEKEVALCNGSSSPPGRLSCENRQSAWKSKHVLLLPHGAPTGSLVVFLPGTGVGPSAYASLLRAAQVVGHHVLGLSYYSNPLSVAETNAWCKERMISVDACVRELHELMLFGNSDWKWKGASMGLWNIAESHSVLRLCVDALRSVSWGADFLEASNTTVIWSRIIIGGHGQGASHAAYLSSKFNVRAVLFGGPQDCQECGVRWLQEMSAQGVPRHALFHKKEGCGVSLILENLKLMGMEMGMEAHPSEWKDAQDALVLNDNSVVMSVAEPTCRYSAQMYHESIAQIRCVSKGISTLWQSMFVFKKNVTVK